MDQLPAIARQDLVVTIQPARLAAACAARGWSYKELARRSRLSRPTVAAARRGVGIRPLSAYKILRALQEAPLADHAADLLGEL